MRTTRTTPIRTILHRSLLWLAALTTAALLVTLPALGADERLPSSGSVLTLDSITARHVLLHTPPQAFATRP